MFEFVKVKMGKMGKNSIFVVNCLRGGLYVVGRGVQMPLIRLPGGAPRLMPADEAAYEGLGLLFCIATNAAGFAMCLQDV